MVYIRWNKPQFDIYEIQLDHTCILLQSLRVLISHENIGEIICEFLGVLSAHHEDQLLTTSLEDRNASVSCLINNEVYYHSTLMVLLLEKYFSIVKKHHYVFLSW